ncbi:MAG: uracil-DNA glycosylase [Burkholderiales bacterium]|nr:uracil-DNA glycosylase [Burkholderiales bacterium]
MAWSERQLAMLRAMGVRLFVPTAPAPAPPERPVRPATAPAQALPTMPADMAQGEAPHVLPADAPLALPVATPHALPAAVAGLDWSALREAVAACRACRLCESRKQTVFGVGHEHARWMVIGEAPGAQEDVQGEPFVGAAGQLLDAMLRALDLSRAADGDPARRVFIANTLKCRPPGNRNPQPDELAACEPFLSRQIELVQPRIILAMGRFAVQSLLRTNEAIGRLRGRVHRYQGVPLVVTYHPAYLLRNLTDKARAWEDLCLAAQVVEQDRTDAAAG